MNPRLIIVFLTFAIYSAGVLSLNSVALPAVGVNGIVQKHAADVQKSGSGE